MRPDALAVQLQQEDQAMRRIVTWSAPLVLVAVAVTGCATKDWGNDKLGKRQGQMDERFMQVDVAGKDVGAAAGTAQGRGEGAFRPARAVNHPRPRLCDR